MTSSTSIDGDEGMDVEDGDSDAGASKLVSSPGSPVMRRGLNMCQVAKSPSNPSASSFPFLQIPVTNLIRSVFLPVRVKEENKYCGEPCSKKVRNRTYREKKKVSASKAGSKATPKARKEKK